MITIDCAGDNELAKELENYLKTKGLSAKTDESFVLVSAENIEGSLNSFLNATNRTGYKSRKVDSTNFVLAREVPIEEFGFFRCEMCGYVMSNEAELINHRRAHGIQLL